MADKPTKNQAADGGQTPSGETPPRDERQETARGGNGAHSAAAASETAEQLRAELAEARDRELRARAELENFKKRARREQEDERRYASVPLLQDLLPVIDNIDRAIEAAEKTNDAKALLEGFKMVRQQFLDVLERHRVVPISALGQPFDPHRHSAITAQPSVEHPEHTVVAVVQEGYELHDRILRPSQVIVSTRPPEPEQPS